MKIGYDVSQTAENKSGTGFFADQLIRALSRIDNQNEYTLFPWFYEYRPSKYRNATKIDKDNFKNILIRDFDDYMQKDGTKLDIIHSNNFTFPRNTKAKKIVTIYDVCFMDCPEYTTEANRQVCYKGTFNSMLYADHIITISNYSKERLLHFFPFVDENKISVVYLGNRNTLLQEKRDKRVYSKFNLKENEYYLSVGTVEPRKNYRTLLKAYSLYKDKSSECKKLCIAGGFGWMEEGFKDEIKKLGLQDYVIVTGYVSDQELSNLYAGCYGFVYPSWYEGFGLPILEAMNFKKPVIASNVTSIPEVTQDKALLVAPGNVEEISEHMLALECDSALYERLAIEGNQRAGSFSWDKAAKEVLKIYNNK